MEDLKHENTNLKDKNAQLQNLLNGIVFVLTDMIGNRDRAVSGHMECMISYVKILVNAMKTKGTYSAEIHELDLDTLYSAACMHDVGKIFIPETVLCKPDKLTIKEFEIMKTHAMEGENIIDQIIARTGQKCLFLHYAKLFAGYHHERWDGKGYPHRLDRLNIPIQGRIMAIVDVYGALISERPYKKPFTSEEAVKIIMDSSGEMFDPLIVEAFYEVRKEFETVKSK